MSLDVNAIKDKIGNEEIFPEQRSAAKTISDFFKREEGYPLLISEPQQGKTGTCLVVTKDFITKCKQDNIPYQVIWLNHITDNVLKQQVEDRLDNSGLDGEVTLIHHANIKDKIEYNNIVKDTNKEILLILDECHIALGKDRPLDSFFDYLGVKYGSKKSEWKNKKVHVVSVSATPYAHAIQNNIVEEVFIPVVLKKTDDYFDLQSLNKKGRIFQSKRTVNVKEHKVTDWFLQVLEEFENNCTQDGNGYLIMRSIGMGPEIISKYIEEHKSNIKFRSYDAEIGNITRLDDKLSEQPLKPTIISIRGCLRAGKTLTTTKHIRGWVESSNAKSDANIQVIGRSLGYKSKDGHSKFDDKFPIYCNKRDWDLAITFYSNSQYIPGGRWSKPTVRKKRGGGNWIMVDNFSKVPEHMILEWSSGKISENTQFPICKRIYENQSGGNNRVIKWDATYEEYASYMRLAKLKASIPGKPDKDGKIRIKKFVDSKAEENLKYHKKCEEELGVKKDFYFYFVHEQEDDQPKFDDPIFGGKLDEDIMLPGSIEREEIISS